MWKVVRVQYSSNFTADPRLTCSFSYEGDTFRNPIYVCSAHCWRKLKHHHVLSFVRVSMKFLHGQGDNEPTGLQHEWNMRRQLWKGIPSVYRCRSTPWSLRSIETCASPPHPNMIEISIVLIILEFRELQFFLSFQQVAWALVRKAQQLYDYVSVADCNHLYGNLKLAMPKLMMLNSLEPRKPGT